MKVSLSTLIGLACAWIGTVYSLFSLFLAGLVGYCYWMMSVDSGPDRFWNCGVLIYGVQFLVVSIFALLAFVSASALLRRPWWKTPLYFCEKGGTYNN